MPSHPLVPLAAAFSMGIAIQHQLGLGPTAWLVAVALGLGLGLAAWWMGASRAVMAALGLTFACLGGQALAAVMFGSPAHHLERLPEGQLASPVRLEGWVVVPPDPRPAEARDSGDPERTRFVVEVTRLQLGERWFPATGRARLTVLGDPLEAAYGNEVRGTFRLRRPRRFDNPGAFDYPAYLATQGIALEGWSREPVEELRASRGSPVLAAIFHWRELLLRRLDAALHAPQAGLLKAMVLGDRSGLSPEMHRAFLESGTYHILAISGLNVSLLAGTLFGLFRLLRASPRLAAAASALLVVLYAALAGAGASVVRAAVMAVAYLLAVVLDRRADLLNSLGLSALALLWWNPRFLFDVGFQLTFLATLGIVLVLPQSEAVLANYPRPLRWLLESVLITLAATAMTLPILAGAFNRVAPVGVLANLPVVPLSGLVTALGTAASSALLVAPGGLPWLNGLNGWLVDQLFGMARWFASWPWSTVRVYTPTPGMLLAYYSLLACAFLAATPAPAGPNASSDEPLADDTRSSWALQGNWQLPVAGRWFFVGVRRWARWLLVASMLALALQVALRLYPPAGPPTVRLTLLDVGQGEAIFLEVPDRGRILVDAGGLPGDRFDMGMRVVAPYMWHEWVGRLDVLVVTHPQSDHIGGVPAILRNFPVGEVWTGEGPSQSAVFLWMQEYLREQRIPHRVVSGGGPPVRWGEASLEVLHPQPRRPGRWPAVDPRPFRPNDFSLVLKVRIGTQAALLTGDIERDGEAALVRSGASLRAQVLKVPHHGSRTSSAEALIAAVGPEVALVSAGYRNRFRHPHPEVVQRYQAAGARILRTDLNGAITVEMTPEGVRAWGRREGS